MYHSVAFAITSLLFLIDLVIPIITDSKAFGILASRGFIQIFRVFLLYFPTSTHEMATVPTAKVAAVIEEKPEAVESIYNFKGQVLDILKSKLDDKDLKFCFDMISQGRIFSNEYKDRVYQPIKIVESNVDTSLTSGTQMKVPAKNSEIYLELDKKICMTLETSIN